MAAISMDGNALRDETVAGLAIRIADLGSPEICLATVLVGDDGPSRRYVNSKHCTTKESSLTTSTRQNANHSQNNSEPMGMARNSKLPAQPRCV